MGYKWPCRTEERKVGDFGFAVQIWNVDDDKPLQIEPQWDRIAAALVEIESLVGAEAIGPFTIGLYPHIAAANALLARRTK